MSKFCPMATSNKSLEVGPRSTRLASHLLAALRSSAAPTLGPLRAAPHSPHQAEEVMLRTAVRTLTWCDGEVECEWNDGVKE